MPIFKKNRTPAYVATIDLSNKEDLKWLYEFRAKISHMNSLRNKHCMNRLYTRYGVFKTRMKIETNGRLGENNPNAKNYRSLHTGKSYPGSHQRIRLCDAAYADVYLREARDEI